MIVAGDTGLAYVDIPIDGDTCYTVVHLPSARFLRIGWFAETEQLAQKWVEWLLQLADWTEPEPKIKPGTLFEVVALVCAGILVDPRLEAHPEFNPVERLWFASPHAA
jgi:hypothetical protein